MMRGFRRSSEEKAGEYLWYGRTPGGRLVHGQREARNAEEVAAELQRHGMTCLQVAVATSPCRWQWPARPPSPRDTAVLLRQLSRLLAAGIPLLTALDLLLETRSPPGGARLLRHLRQTILSGESLGAAMQLHPQVFSSLTIRLVQAGEHSGTLERQFVRAAVHLEKQIALRQRVHQALRYPLLVLLVACGVCAALLAFVVPQFTHLFQEFGAPLPGLTRSILAGSSLVTEWGPGVALSSLLLIMLLRRGYSRWPAWQKVMDRSLLATPWIGSLRRKTAVAGFASTLAHLLSAGIPMVEALRSVAGTTGSHRYDALALQIRADTAAGRSLTETLRQSGAFPILLLQMVAIGEESGTLDTALAKMGLDLEEEIDREVLALTQWLEPLLILTLGGVVGTIVAALYLPIFQLGQVF
jgi:type IV pilus assembly protein PilC